MNSCYRDVRVLYIAAVTFCVLIIVMGNTVAKAKEAEVPPWELPWELREHFSFNVDKGTINYAADNGEWQINVEGVGSVVDKAGFQITFKDGTVLDNRSLGQATADYERFTDALGEGMLFSITFPPKDGILIHHSMSVNSERPFALVTLDLVNNREKPIEVAKITSAAIAPGGITKLTPNADVMSRHVSFRGANPVFNKNASPTLAIFNDAARDICFCLGMMPRGIATSHVTFTPSGDGWGGEVVCEYDPPVHLAPGEKLESNPIWISAGVPDPVDVDVLNAWTASVVWNLEGADGLLPATEANATLNANRPRSWTTVEEGESLSQLQQLRDQWSSARPQGVLVPISWEGRPGSLNGAVPRYPKNMSKVASELRSAGTKAGITVDPLLTDEGNSDWTAESSDGRGWLNLSKAEARAFAVKRMKKVVDWDFDFFAIAPSGIPAEVLRHFNMTRAQADQLAFAVMMEAAENRPVLPTTAYTVKADLDLWLEVAASSSCMATYGIPPGPVRFDVNDVKELSDDLITAMIFFDGPIELLDRAKPKVENALALVFSQNCSNKRPIDAAKRPPRVWHITPPSLDADYQPGVVAMFAGAGAWEVGAVVDKGLQPLAVRIWRAEDGTFVDTDSGSVPAADRFTLYGVMPVLERPVLMGASVGTGLLLDDMASLSWHEEKSILAGTFNGRHRQDATAYVYIPEGWAFDSGKAGDISIRKKSVSDRIEFPVPKGKSVHFEFEFVRQ